MHAYEFCTTLTADKNVVLPSPIAAQIPANVAVRVIILVEDDQKEERDWLRFGAEQFFKGYAAEDSIYERYDELRSE